MPVLVVAALGQPIAGVVFVLDGVLIGAGDGRYLAWAGLVVLAVYTPAAFAAAYLTGGLVAVWVAFAAVFMGARFVVLTRRARGDPWLVTGASRTPAPSRQRSPPRSDEAHAPDPWIVPIERPHHGDMTTFKRLVRRFDAYTLEVFNPPITPPTALTRQLSGPWWRRSQSSPTSTACCPCSMPCSPSPTWPLPSWIVVTGDHAAGPMPVEVLDRLVGLGDRCLLVRGNADRELVEVARGRDSAIDVSNWAGRQLRPDQVELLDGSPPPGPARGRRLRQGRVLPRHTA